MADSKLRSPAFNTIKIFIYVKKKVTKGNEQMDLQKEDENNSMSNRNYLMK